MEKVIYLDNAATTFPKPEQVYVAMDQVNRRFSVNPGRGSYALAKEAAQLVERTRKKVCLLAGASDKDAIIFTPSVTIAINQILGGIPWEEHNCVYVSPFEHNSVLRTLEYFSQIYHFQIKELPIKHNGNGIEIDLNKLSFCFVKEPPSHICMTHISNVTGYILPIKEIAFLGKNYGAVVIVDGAQSFGLIPISLANLEIDFFTFAGHKTLYGPFGIGGFIQNTKIILKPYIFGGTGSASLSLIMPKEGVERYEPGSLNVVAVAGLEAALDVLQDGAQKVYEEKERFLTGYLVEQLEQIENVIVYALADTEKEMGIVSFNVCGYLADELGVILDEDYKIAVRTGHHCAAFIHAHLKDEQYFGTVRASIGRFTTKEEIDQLVKALKELVKE